MNFSICLEMIFPGLPFGERMDRVKQAGFSAVEFWAWRDKDLGAFARRVAAGMEVTTFSGHRKGSLIYPQDEGIFFAEVREAVAAARRLRCPSLMILTQELGEGGRVQAPWPVPAQWRETALPRLKKLGPIGEENGVTFLLEPLNDRLDHFHYVLTASKKAVELIRAVAHPHVRLLYDLYHMGMMGEDVKKRVLDNLEWIGYLHAADVPGRHEPGTGKIPFPEILQEVRRAGWKGTVGFEYAPAGETGASLERIARLRDALGV